MTPQEILNIRRDNDMTQAQLAEYVGVTSHTVYRWEKGRKKPQGPARKLLAQIAHKKP